MEQNPNLDGGGRSTVRRVTNKTKTFGSGKGASRPLAVAVVAAAGGGIQFHLLVGGSLIEAFAGLEAKLAGGDRHLAIIDWTLFRELAGQLAKPDPGPCGPCGSRRYLALTTTDGCLLQLRPLRAMNAALAAAIVTGLFPFDQYICTVEVADIILIANAFAKVNGPRLFHIQPRDLN